MFKLIKKWVDSNDNARTALIVATLEYVFPLLLGMQAGLAPDLEILRCHGIMHLAIDNQLPLPIAMRSIKMDAFEAARLAIEEVKDTSPCKKTVAKFPRPKVEVKEEPEGKDANDEDDDEQDGGKPKRPRRIYSCDVVIMKFLNMLDDPLVQIARLHHTRSHHYS